MVFVRVGAHLFEVNFPSTASRKSDIKDVELSVVTVIVERKICS